MRFKLFCLMAATTWQLAACATEPQTRIAPGEAEPDVATPAIVSEPSFDEVFNLVIETERHSVMIGNAMHGVSVNMMDDRLDDGAEIYRVDHALRSGVRDLIALRDALCIQRIEPDTTCHSIQIPAWVMSPPDVEGTSLAEYQARSEWLSEIMQPYISAGCDVGRNATGEEMFCAVE